SEIDLEKLALSPRLATSAQRLSLILYSDGAVAREESLALRKLEETCVVQRAHSRDRLFDQTALALHCAMTQLSLSQQQLVDRLRRSDNALANKKVLIVDDDIRNIFALSSALDPHNMRIVSAETGRGAIEILKSEGDVDVVLMDIMMPEMDGYETIRAI